MGSQQVSDLLTFQSVIEKIRSFIAEKKGSLRIQFPFFADFFLDKKYIDEWPDSEKEIISREVEPLVSLLLSGKEINKESLEIFLPFEEELLNNENIINDFVIKCDSLKEKIYNQELKEIIEIRRSTKHYLLRNIKWEINRKLFTSDTIDEKSFKYATVSFTFDEKTTFISPYGNPFTLKTLSIDMHLKDIQDLIHDLNEIENKLEVLK